jgi:hypothetical protein
VLDPQQAAGMSESQGAIDAKASYKERPISAAPTKAAHLHDKTARNALKRLETRFHTSATTIAPAPGTDTTNWPLHNYALVTFDATAALKSRSGRSRVNKTGDSDGNTPQLPSLDIRVHSAHGGRQGFELMLEHALLSGEFDHVLSRVNQLRNESSEIQYNYNTSFVGSAAEMNAIHDATKQTNKKAGGKRTNKDITEDPAIGSQSHDLPDDDDEMDRTFALP